MDEVILPESEFGEVTEITEEFSTSHCVPEPPSLTSDSSGLRTLSSSNVAQPRKNTNTLLECTQCGGTITEADRDRTIEFMEKKTLAHAHVERRRCPLNRSTSGLLDKINERKHESKFGWQGSKQLLTTRSCNCSAHLCYDCLISTHFSPEAEHQSSLPSPCPVSPAAKEESPPQTPKSPDAETNDDKRADQGQSFRRRFTQKLFHQKKDVGPNVTPLSPRPDHHDVFDASTDPSIAITSEGRVATRTLAFDGSWVSICVKAPHTHGLHSWGFKLPETPLHGLVLGIVPSKAHGDVPTSQLSGTTGGYGFDVVRRHKGWYQPDGEGKTEEYGEKCKGGDIVAMVLDLEAKTLSYQKNDGKISVAFSGVSGSSFRACVSLRNKGDAVEIV